jgi:hypothetical protein
MKKQFVLFMLTCGLLVSLFLTGCVDEEKFRQISSIALLSVSFSNDDVSNQLITIYDQGDVHTKQERLLYDRWNQQINSVVGNPNARRKIKGPAHFEADTRYKTFADQRTSKWVYNPVPYLPYFIQDKQEPDVQRKAIALCPELGVDAIMTIHVSMKTHTKKVEEAKSKRDPKTGKTKTVKSGRVHYKYWVDLNFNYLIYNSNGEKIADNKSTKRGSFSSNDNYGNVIADYLGRREGDLLENVRVGLERGINKSITDAILGENNNLLPSGFRESERALNHAWDDLYHELNTLLNS